MKKDMNNFFKTTGVSFVLTLVVLVLVGNMPLMFAAVMNSTSYSIQSDSVNIGGVLGSSTNYTAEDTVGEVGTGYSSSTNYSLHAGYQQMSDAFISMTASADVVMSPSLGGITGGTSNASASTTVITDSAAGYELYFKASSTPAMQGVSQGDTIANYTPVSSDPDYTFAVANTDSEFGFSPEGTDVVNKYRDNGSACNVGSGETADRCWNAITTSNELIASRTSSNQPSGTKTTVKFRLTIGSSSFKIEDVYNATTTLTAVAL